MQNLIKNFKLRVAFFVIFIIYLSINLISQQSALMSKKRELRELEESKQQIELEIIATNALLDESDTATYIENVAREKLGYAYPGEKIFIDIRAE